LYPLLWKHKTPICIGASTSKANCFHRSVHS